MKVVSSPTEPPASWPRATTRSHPASAASRPWASEVATTPTRRARPPPGPGEGPQVVPVLDGEQHEVELHVGGPDRFRGRGLHGVTAGREGEADPAAAQAGEAFDG